MSTSTLTTSLFLTTLLLLHFPPSTSHPFRHTTSLYSNNLSSSAPSPAPSPPPPTTFFEVTRPIPHPKTKPCSYLILNHSFASTYGKPPVTAPYTPPFSTCLRSHSSFSKIILEWNATSTGRQFDRIFSIWLDGVELLRSCTAEPRPNGSFWKVEKDITKYYSHLISSNRTLAVYMGNVVDKTYTGIYHANIAIHFYPSETKTRCRCHRHNFADLILPISRPLPLNDGLWFEVENSTDVKRKEIKIPLNVYRAVLEVYVSFHENDEFWYSNYPNDYMVANNITGVPGNGPFREVVVTLDGDTIVGVVWPFTVIHTGGINPLLWRPITAIGSYDLPTYDIELTPQLGMMLDEKRNHTIEFRVTNGMNSWFVSGNLHLWVDKKREKTEAGVVERNDDSSQMPQQLHLETAGNFIGLNGNFTTKGSRTVKTMGWVKSSIGNITTSFKQELRYVNNMMIGNNGGMQEVNQKIGAKSSVKRSEVREKRRIQSHVTHEAKRFSLYLYQDVENNGSLYVTNVSLGFEVDTKIGMPGHYSMTELRNSQDAVGNMVLKDGLVSGGVGATKQSYGFNWRNTVCYNRDIAASNYTIMYDQQSNSECGGRPRGNW